MIYYYPIEKIRSDFPILNKKIYGNSLIYLDSAASAQKPQSVIDCISKYYCRYYSSVHRGIHKLSIQATIDVENVREKIAKFINANYTEEIIFVKNTTEGINLVANCLNRQDFFQEGDNIIITEMEHHANIVPWQLISQYKKIYIRTVPLLKDGTLNVDIIPSLIDKKTKLFAITHISNVLGTINPICFIINTIREVSKKIIILVDGAQSIMHKKIDVQKMDCDFYVFSGHKIYGPSGIGVLYGKKNILEQMPPWQVGGAMIRTVHLNKNPTFLDPPFRFEAGSPNITGIIGLGEAINYINNIEIDNIQNYEYNLMQYTLNSLKKVPNVYLYGPKKDRIGVVSFNLINKHAYDIGLFLDQYGIAIRTGHHCAMPIMDYFHVSSMCRISLALYTNTNDIDFLIEKLIHINNILK